MEKGPCGREECPVMRLFSKANPPLEERSVAACISQLLAAKQRAGRRAVYLSSLKRYLTWFAKGREEKPLSSVTRQEIEDYLAKHSGQSYATHLNRIKTLFSYAVEVELIHRNPTKGIVVPKFDRKPPRILTPEECEALYFSCPDICRPYLIVCLYAGVRPDEGMRLTWADISLDEKRILLNASSSKVRQRRIVPLCEKAVRLLSRHPDKTGPIAPSHSTCRRWKRQARGIIGKWDADVLRHTFCSYSLAVHQDANKVAYWMGSSAGILKQHYDGLASLAAATRFFGEEGKLQQQPLP